MAAQHAKVDAGRAGVAPSGRGRKPKNPVPLLLVAGGGALLACCSDG
jgi:hypothetical protein